MKISRSTAYGLISTCFIAQSQQNGPVLANTISKEYNIPVEYLLKILQQLVRANILTSKRGPRGGFSMARNASEISMLEIIQAINGILVNDLELAEQTNNAPFSLKMEKVCEQANAGVAQIMGQAKVSDFIEA